MCMTTLFHVTLGGGAMIAATALLRLTLRERLPRAAYLFFWGAALVRLLTPAEWISPIGLFGRMPSAAANCALSSLPFAAAPQDDRLRPLLLLWLGGMLLCAGWLTVRELAARRALRTAVRVHNPLALSLLSRFAFRRPVSLRSDRRLTAPVTYGLLRPVVVLPETLAQTDSDALRFSLLHELCHVRHADYLWKMLAACAICVHWFNPLVWLLFSLLGRDLEIYCDEQALRRCQPGERAAYARCLLDFAAGSSPSPLTSHFKQKALEERILLMMTSRKISLAGLALATALLVGTASAFAVSDTQAAERAASAADSKPAQTTENTDALDFEIVDSPEGPAFKLEASKFVKLEDGSYRYTFDDGSTVVVTTGITLENTQ